MASLFLKGTRATNPFKTAQVRGQEKEFSGKKHPAFFKFKGKDYGKELHRDCHINQRCRVVFETDAVNDYFSRKTDPGEFSLYLNSASHRLKVSDYVGPILHNGVATLTVRLPINCEVGDGLQFEAVVADPTLLDPFTNKFAIDIKAAAEAQAGTKGASRKPPSDEARDDREVASGISLPNPIPVREADWGKYDPPFDKHTALRIRIDEEPHADNGGPTQDVYDFFINMDNLFFKTELKSAGDEIDLVAARWKYALVLIGLAVLHDEAKKPKGPDDVREEDNGQTVETRVEKFTRAIAPVLLPMIDSLGALEVDALSTVASGEAT